MSMPRRAAAPTRGNSIKRRCKYSKAFGPDHPYIPLVLDELAACYYKQHKYAEAEPLLKKSLAIPEKTRGPDHPDVEVTLRNLAALYKDEGRYSDAEPLYKRSFGDGSSSPVIEIPNASGGSVLNFSAPLKQRNNLSLFLAATAELFELGEHRLDVELLAWLLFLRLGLLLRCGRHRSRQQRRARLLHRCRLLLCRLLDFQIEIDLRAQPERHRIERRQIRRVPVRAFADCLDGRFGGADEPHDLAVFELGVIAHEPEDRVRPVLTPRHRRVARPLLRLGLGQAHLWLGNVQPAIGIGLRCLDLLARQLPGEDRIETLDALRRIAIGNRFDLERMQMTQFGDLIERQ